MGGQTIEPAQAASAAPAPAKTEKELAKEKAKAEKAAKFEAKQAKMKEKKKAATVQQLASEAKPAPARETPALPAFKDSTPLGEKKRIRSFEDPYFQAFHPKAVESGWYAWWEQSGFFRPEARSDSPVGQGKKFVIALPPPNVTGALHCGHALANTLQDCLIRWHRMRGFTTLWIPGCDHAGISTQSVVEKMLMKKEKKTRHDLGREAFTKLVWEWKEEYHERINNAQRLMGGSMDWSREAFTMDENATAATMESFCQLHDEGLIYRSDKLVNWDTHLCTALSNLEVDNKEITGRTLLDVPGYDRKVEFGVLTYFKYPIDGSDGFVEVATTRPETMLGDTGIAVNPSDPRYSHLVDQCARHPFTDRLMPIVADDYVDKDFGTGCVKLTPAHDYNDYQLGKRHKLDFVRIFNPDGTLNDNAGPKFAGQKRFDARYNVTQALQELGLFVKKEPNPMKVPLSEKSRDVIEPLMVPQWWVRMDEMASAGLDAVSQGKIKITPETAKKSYERWLSGITDWCISRQLWWGHRIPAYRLIFEGDDDVETPDSTWVVGRDQAEAEVKAKQKYPDKQFVLKQDEDCLDTWFSSGLWPMEILGWPKQETTDFDEFFPTSLLETGWDIMFFWVARMIMLSLKLTGEVPFREVYAHSLIRDSEGRKMSKSLGNVIDPLDIINGIELEQLHAKLYVGNLRTEEIEKAIKYQKTAFAGGIPECGADALRFTLLSYTTGGGDISFDIKVMHAYRRFCNKLFQASKYVLGKLPENFTPVTEVDTSSLSVPERWILHRMNTAVRNINQALEDREFSKLTQVIYQFFYDELCDVFIENSKTLLTEGTPAEQASVQRTLYRALDVSLRAIHPAMPYITEELWQRLPKSGSGTPAPSVMLARFPEYDANLEFPEDAGDYEMGLECARGLRSLSVEYNVRGDGRAFIKTSTQASHGKISKQLADIKTLGGRAIAELSALGAQDATPEGCAVYMVSADVAVLLQVGDRIVDLKAEIKKIGMKLQKSCVAIQKQRELMGREGFEKASDVVKASEEKKLADAEAAKENYEKTLSAFNGLAVGGQ